MVWIITMIIKEQYRYALPDLKIRNNNWAAKICQKCLHQFLLLEAEVSPFGDNNMVQDTDTHNTAGFA